MKSQPALWALILILLIAGITSVGVSATADDPETAKQTLLLYMGVATMSVTGVLTYAKTTKTVEKTEATEKKVDHLLNGELTGKVAKLEADFSVMHSTVARNSRRLNDIETVALEILETVKPKP